MGLMPSSPDSNPLLRCFANLSDCRKRGCGSSPRDADGSGFIGEVNCVGNRGRFCEGCREAADKAVSCSRRVDGIYLVTLGFVSSSGAAEQRSARAQGCNYGEQPTLM